MVPITPINAVKTLHGTLLRNTNKESYLPNEIVDLCERNHTHDKKIKHVNFLFSSSDMMMQMYQSNSNMQHGFLLREQREEFFPDCFHYKLWLNQQVSPRRLLGLWNMSLIINIVNQDYVLPKICQSIFAKNKWQCCELAFCLLLAPQG